MRSYNVVLNKNKRFALEQRQNTINEQKKQVLEALKLDNFYNGKITDLPKSKQEKYLKALLEYWSPKHGLNKAGEKYLSKGIIALNEKSDSTDVKKYILTQVTLNEKHFLKAFKTNKAKQIVEALKSDIEGKVGKKLSNSSVFNVVYNAIEDKLKLEMMK